MISACDINMLDEGVARFLGCISAAHFTCPHRLVGLGLSITDFHGHLSSPHVEVYVQSGETGQKTFLTADQARMVAEELSRLADLLEAGATSGISQ